MQRCARFILMLSGVIGIFPAAGLSQNEQAPSRWSLETDVLWPIFPGATRTHVLYQRWQKGQFRGDVYGGLNIDFPQNRETEGRFADYSIASGYRQYLWKGLHVEFSQTTGMRVLQNHVTTGKTYRSFDWLVSGYRGYRFSLAQQKFYLLPQFGVAGVIYKSKPWPIFTDKPLTQEAGEALYAGSPAVWLSVLSKAKENPWKTLVWMVHKKHAGYFPAAGQ